MYLREYAEPLADRYLREMQEWGHLPDARTHPGVAEEMARKGLLRYYGKSPFATTAVRVDEALRERGCQEFAGWVLAVVYERYEGESPQTTPQEEVVALRAVIDALDWPPDYSPYPRIAAPDWTYMGMQRWSAADRRRVEELHWQAFRLAQARLDILEADGAPMTVGRPRPRVSKEERERLVRDYLGAHKGRASKGEVSIREVSEETGVPVTSVHGTVAWIALQERLDRLGRSKRPRKRNAQAFTGKMDAVVEDAQLTELMREQAADDEGSPLDKGRRGKTRVRKKF
jgi:hypothetical protein